MTFRPRITAEPIEMPNEMYRLGWAHPRYHFVLDGGS